MLVTFNDGSMVKVECLKSVFFLTSYLYLKKVT
jgi:hypothetical protein